MTRLELAPSTLNIDGGQGVALYEAVERMLYEAVERMTRLELATSTVGRASRSTKRWSGFSTKGGADDETRTRDIDLGKVALYQLSYIRVRHPVGAARGSYLTRSGSLPGPGRLRACC
jgi:hypothetical protein